MSSSAGNKGQTDAQQGRVYNEPRNANWYDRQEYAKGYQSGTKK